MSGGTVPLRLISLILLFSLIPPARASYVAPKQIHQQVGQLLCRCRRALSN